MNHFIIEGQYKNLLQSQGIKVSEVLKKAQLPEDALNHKSIHLKEEEYYRMFSAIEDLGYGENIALKLANSDQIESFSPPIFASYCSKDGMQCMERLSTYKKLVGPMTFCITERDETISISLKTGDEELKIPKFLAISELAFLMGILQRATKEEIHPVKVSVASEIKEKETKAYFGIEVMQGEENAITFRREDLSLPFITYNEAMWGYFEPELAKRLSELDIDDSMSARVRSALTELLPGGQSSIEDVAEKLGLSKRTLQRKLSLENTTFQKQLNSTREVLAMHYMKNTDMSSRDVAYLLGYAELNSFLRAFSIWTGKSVSEYRG